MRYVIEAGFVKVLSAPRRLRQKPVLHALWQVFFCLPMACLSYMGLLMAVTVAAVAPSVLVATHADNPDLWFFVSMTNLVGIGAAAVYMIFNFYRRMRYLLTLDADVAVALVGLLVAFSFILLTLLEGDALGVSGT